MNHTFVLCFFLSKVTLSKDDLIAIPDGNWQLPVKFQKSTEQTGNLRFSYKIKRLFSTLPEFF